MDVRLAPCVCLWRRVCRCHTIDRRKRPKPTLRPAFPSTRYSVSAVTSALPSLRVLLSVRNAKDWVTSRKKNNPNELVCRDSAVKHAAHYFDIWACLDHARLPNETLMRIDELTDEELAQRFAHFNRVVAELVRVCVCVSYF